MTTEKPPMQQITLPLQGEWVTKKNIAARLGYPADGRLFRYDIQKKCNENPLFAGLFEPHKTQKRVPADVALEVVKVLCPFAEVTFAFDAQQLSLRALGTN